MAEHSGGLIERAFLNRRGERVELLMLLGAGIEALPDEAIVEIPCGTSAGLSFVAVFEERDRSRSHDTQMRRWVTMTLEVPKRSRAWRTWICEGVIQDRLERILVRFKNDRAEVSLLRMSNPAAFCPQETARMAA